MEQKTNNDIDDNIRYGVLSVLISMVIFFIFTGLMIMELIDKINQLETLIKQLCT